MRIIHGAALVGIGLAMGWEIPVQGRMTRPDVETAKCVKFMIPDVPGYTPTRAAHSMVIFLDAPIFDATFPGCNDWTAIALVTPEHVIHVMRGDVPGYPRQIDLTP